MFSRSERLKFMRIMDTAANGVALDSFVVVPDIPVGNGNALRGTLDDGRKIAWVKPENTFYITTSA